VDALTDIAELMIETRQPALAGKLISEAEGLLKSIPEVDLQTQSEERLRKIKASLGKAA
jgi:hypothetical protein